MNETREPALRVVDTDESLRAHLATEVIERQRSEDEVWRAIDRIADCYQGLLSSFQWMRRMQWVIIVLSAIGILTSVGSAAAFWYLVRYNPGHAPPTPVLPVTRAS